VADQPERVVPALRRDDLHLGAVRHRCREVAQLAVDLDSERRTGQPLADRARHVEAAGSLGNLELRLVWQLNRHAAWNLHASWRG
jgi:hypothetical protein